MGSPAAIFGRGFDHGRTLVSPGMGAVLHTRFLRSVLMMDDLPTLGYPKKPTLTCFLSLCSTPAHHSPKHIMHVW